MRDNKGRFIKGHKVPEEWNDKMSNTQFQKGQETWNKGTHIQSNTGRTHFKKGHPFGKRFKKGEDTWNKGMKGFLAEDKHYLWKGDDAGYGSKHEWISRKYGKADRCENPKCLSKNPEWFHWSNKGHTYKRFNRNDWQMLCVSCHRLYDYSVQAPVEAEITPSKV